MSGALPHVPAAIGALPLRLCDSIAELAPPDAGSIVVSGSHGGRSAARYALAMPLALVAFNDAGIGKDDAGIVALQLLDDAGTPCVTVSHASARIGEARDAWDHGVVSFVNARALTHGVARTGRRCAPRSCACTAQPRAPRPDRTPASR